MASLTGIIRSAGPSYLEAHRHQVLPSQRRAIHDISVCRTPALGGRMFVCPCCGEPRAVYYSCGNRHCGQCQVNHSELWLAKQRALLLPTTYLLITCTLPAQLRALAFDHQRMVYSILMRATARAVTDVIADPRFVGGRAAILAVLHTWSRAMLHHPHVHILVPAGGLANAHVWRMPRNKLFPIPSFAVAHHFRLQMRDALVDTGLVSGDEPIFQSRWVANVKKVGSGEKALLYLSRYVFRTAISDDRIDDFDGDHVTFHWHESGNNLLRSETLTTNAFIDRFLLHVLPRGFTRIRYYGLWAPACRPQLLAARAVLDRHNAALGLPMPEPVHCDPPSMQPYCLVCGALYDKPLCYLPRKRGPPP